MSLKKYNKRLDYSYALGFQAVLDLIENSPKLIRKIVMRSNVSKSPSAERIRMLSEDKRLELQESDSAFANLKLQDNIYAFAVFSKYETQLEAGANHVLLVNPSDKGNLGTIMRTCLGFGIRNIAIIRPAIDVFDPVVVRASMGAQFQLNFAYYDSFAEYAKTFSEHTYFPFMLTAKNELANVSFKSPYTLIFGNEGQGLPRDFERIGNPVRIRQAAGIDSLNLAVAVGIALYAATDK
jgi:TrmH family RNA methyltransferase